MWHSVRQSAAWMADHEIWPLALGVALASLTTRWAIWGLGLIAGLWLVRWVGRGRLTVRTPLDWPVCLLLLMVPVTFYATIDAQTTFVGASRLLAGIGLAYGLVNWGQRENHIALLVLGLVGLGLALALVAPFTVGWFSRVKSFLIPGQVYELLPTLVSDTIHPNIMAGMLVMLLPFPLAVLLLGPQADLPPVDGTVPDVLAGMLGRRWLRWLGYAGAFLLMSGVLLLTKSRGAWIAGALVLSLLMTRRYPRLFALIPIALLGVGLVAWQVGIPTLLDTISTSGAVSGWAGRMEIWRRAIQMIQDFPFTGIGIGNFEPVANVFYPFFLAGSDANVPHAHNLLLQVGVDLGLLGLIAYLAILLLSLWCALDSMRSFMDVGNEIMATIAWAGWVSLLAMLVQGMLDAATWVIGRGSFVPWIVIGLVITLHRMVHEK